MTSRTVLRAAMIAATLLPSHRPQAATPAYDRCIAAIDNGGFVKSQTLECATRDMDRADGALNATYRAVMAKLPAGRRNALRDEERAWIDARHDRCRLDRADPIPSPEINRMLCLVRETDARTAEIERFR